MKQLPWWVRLAVSASVIGVVAWKLPVVELLTLCFYVVLLPLGFAAMWFTAADALYEGLAGTFNTAMAEIRRRVEEAREQHRYDQAA